MSNFNSYTNALDLSYWHECCAKEGTLRHFAKGEMFARRGNRLRYWGISVRGYFKYALTDTDGNVHVTGFAFKNEFIGDYLSIVNGQPLRTDIIAAADADVMLCNVNMIRRIFEEQPELRYGLAERLFQQAYTQYLDMHIKSPKERYLELLRRCPGILQNITLKEMSSYLNITPTHLSRIRRELTFT